MCFLSVQRGCIPENPVFRSHQSQPLKSGKEKSEEKKTRKTKLGMNSKSYWPDINTFNQLKVFNVVSIVTGMKGFYGNCRAAQVGK